MSEPIAMCFSGGKDSALALYHLRTHGAHDVVELITTVTDAYDRVELGVGPRDIAVPHGGSGRRPSRRASQQVPKRVPPQCHSFSAETARAPGWRPAPAAPAPCSTPSQSASNSR